MQGFWSSFTSVPAMACVVACSGEPRAGVPVVALPENDAAPSSHPVARSADAFATTAASSRESAPPPSDPVPPTETPPACVVKPPARAAALGLGKTRLQKRTVAVYAIERERGACRVRYAEGDNEDSLAAAPEICDANPCLAVGQMFRAQLRLVEADIPCGGASFCANAGPTYRADLVVELTPQ